MKNWKKILLMYAFYLSNPFAFLRICETCTRSKLHINIKLNMNISYSYLLSRVYNWFNNKTVICDSTFFNVCAVSQDRVCKNEYIFQHTADFIPHVACEKVWITLFHALCLFLQNYSHYAHNVRKRKEASLRYHFSRLFQKCFRLKHSVLSGNFFRKNFRDATCIHNVRYNIHNYCMFYIIHETVRIPRASTWMSMF